MTQLKTYQRPEITFNIKLGIDYNEYVRVGRWMSQNEYSKMINTGRVQMSSNGNTTYIANPSDILGFYRHAKTGSLYVDFDVSKSAIYPAGKSGW